MRQRILVFQQRCDVIHSAPVAPVRRLVSLAQLKTKDIAHQTWYTMTKVAQKFVPNDMKYVAICEREHLFGRPR